MKVNNYHVHPLQKFTLLIQDFRKLGKDMSLGKTHRKSSINNEYILKQP